MKNLLKTTFTSALILLLSLPAITQEWTKEQNEVWKVVEDEWAKWKSGDVDGVAAMVHEKYQGWSIDSPLPMGKQKMIQWYRDMKDMMKVSYYSIEPARISVTKNAAVVDYYFSFSVDFTMNDKKETKEMEGKTAEFYVKEDGKWQLLGDMMIHDGDDEEEEDDD
jgi:hypothetical protein